MSASLPLSVPAAETAPPPARRDFLPLVLVPGLILAALPLLGLSNWLALTVAGLGMGMMVFIMASGLTLVFGLMGVLNFGHGAFVSVGAYVAALVLLPMRGWLELDSLGANLAALGLAVGGAMAATFVLGWAFERVVIRPVYGHHLKQILVTMGGMIVAEQLITALWGADQIPVPMPASLGGAFIVGEAAIEKYRLFAAAVGLLVFGLMFLILNRTRIGLLIRAGVENGPMVEALGYRIRRVFVLVFAAGSALAGLGGALWGVYKGVLNPGIGGEVLVMVFIVIIIGGLGSVGGCFIGALLLALVSTYAGFLLPKLGLISNIVLMIVVLLWRPAGLYVQGRH